VSVLSGVIFNIWSTVTFTQQESQITASTAGQDQVDLSERAVTFLLYGGNGPYLLPLLMILICSCFVLIHRQPHGVAGPLLWTNPASRFAELQAEVVGLGVLAGVVALGYAGAAVLAFTVARPLLPVE
jgi:hypothetical protein